MTADAAVLATALIAGIFALGLEIGQQTAPMTCPTVPGQQVVSTSTSPVGQHCTYANSYGRSLKRVKL